MVGEMYFPAPLNLGLDTRFVLAKELLVYVTGAEV